MTNAAHTNNQKVSKLRIGAAALLGTVGISLIGSLAPAIASASSFPPIPPGPIVIGAHNSPIVGAHVRR
jgi:hypothetical protein